MSETKKGQPEAVNSEEKDWFGCNKEALSFQTKMSPVLIWTPTSHSGRCPLWNHKYSLNLKTSSRQESLPPWLLLISLQHLLGSSQKWWLHTLQKKFVHACISVRRKILLAEGCWRSYLLKAALWPCCWIQFKQIVWKWKTAWVTCFLLILLWHHMYSQAVSMSTYGMVARHLKYSSLIFLLMAINYCLTPCVFIDNDKKECEFRFLRHCNKIIFKYLCRHTVRPIQKSTQK